MENAKIHIPLRQRKPLINQILTGEIRRSEFPEVFQKTVTWWIDDQHKKIETFEPEPATVPKTQRRDLIRAVLRGEVTTSEYPEIWQPFDNIQVNLPTWTDPAELNDLSMNPKH